MSGSFDFRSGVGTQMITTSLRCRTEKSVVAAYLPARISDFRSSSVRSGVQERPRFSEETRSGSLSMPDTVNPARANSVARGRPTYPWPMIAIWALWSRIRCSSDVEITLSPPSKIQRDYLPYVRFLCGGVAVRADRLRTLAEHHDLHRVEEDAHIEPERQMLDVVEVVAHLLRLFLEVVRVPQPDLRPARDARANRGPQRVIRDAFSEELEVRDRMRPRAHEIHVATDDVDELGQLVETEFPEPFADPRDPVAVVVHPLRRGPVGHAHRPEFDQLEPLSVQAEAVLDEKE